MRPSLLQMQMMMAVSVDGTYAGDYVTFLAAYGITKLVRGYTGSAIRVRRSSDNAEADIGFVGKALDTAALAAHVGADSGYVAEIYDQTGAGNDMLQATATKQPMIVNAGTYLGYVVGDGTGDFMQTAGDVGSGTATSATLFGRYAVEAAGTSLPGVLFDAGYYVSGKNGFGMYFDPRPITTAGYNAASSKSTVYNAFSYQPSTAISAVKALTMCVLSAGGWGGFWIDGDEQFGSGSDSHEAFPFVLTPCQFTLGARADGSQYSLWKLDSFGIVEGDATGSRVSVEAAL